MSELEKEIKIASDRIEERQVEIEEELNKLKDQIETYTQYTWFFVWLGFGVSMLGIVFYYCKHTLEEFGLNLLGDFMAGTVASIWSLAGLFLIYVAFLGQKQQLLNQQLEIMYSQLEVKYTRLELSEQKEEMKAQNNTLRQQKFENTFFQMLSLFATLVNSIDIRAKDSKSNVITQGRDCFQVFYTRLLSKLRYQKFGSETAAGDLSRSPIKETITAFGVMYDRNKADMSHYFRTIYHIIKLIDKSEIENKKQYISLARAQLSSYEQVLIFYNCLHENGTEKFKPLIEKYALMKNLDTSLIINQQHLHEYNASAYGR